MIKSKIVLDESLTIYGTLIASLTEHETPEK